AAMGVMFLLFSGIRGMQSIDADRRELTLSRTFASPTTATTYLFGKFFGTVAIAFCQFIILALGTTLLFKVNWGAPLTMLSIALAYSWAVSGMALALASLVTNNQAATGAWSILVQVFSALGGSMIPLAVFPPAMRAIAQFTPNYWGLQGLLAGMQNGPFPWSSVLALLALGTVTLVVGSFRMRA
ncbi:MAG TPA: ABC transporter permease, partial [Verrucomicrobiae bacterium]|nr:ABC transporter permease [Verrucomicrobiae bacterium]